MAVLITHDGRSLGRAFGASLAVHVLVAVLLVPMFLTVEPSGTDAVEAISFEHILRAQIERPQTTHVIAAAPDTSIRARSVTFEHRRRELSTNRLRPHARPKASSGPVGLTAHAAAPRRVAVRSVPLFARAVASSQPSISDQASAQRTPQPETTVNTQQVDSSGEADRGGVLPLGERQDPALDPGVRDKLARAYGGHVTLVVTVGDDGRTKNVVFQPPIDATAERQIEAILAAANWDAAVCGGGIACQGVATIKL